MVQSDGNDSVDSKQDTTDMALFVQNLLQQMMGSRIDELEQSINDLKAEMGAENSPPPVPPAEKDDSKSPNES
ncbi:heat shock factor-binding protein 1-like [Gossypium australe]|uniref:Heat shock factor-binding protein 1-like n=1 Tax=Gossypium australe TaxID=47621 RepID=A0A5B6WV26_9ROSI|nr:heat shock factor-binding protein 1-like [Gossypium australe]